MKGFFMQANLNAHSKSGSTAKGAPGKFSFKAEWKKEEVISIDPEAPLWEAVQLMKQHQVGDVLVVTRADGRGKPLGMVTDRDIALSLTENIDFKHMKVMDVMSGSVVTAPVDEDLFVMIRLMKSSGVTRLPLTDPRGHVVGVVTAKNILQILVSCFFDVTQISERQQENEEAQQH